MERLFLLMAAVTLGSVTMQGGMAAPTNSAPSTDKKTPGNSTDDIINGCKNNPADIYFLLDCSSSVWIVDFDKQLDFVASLVKRLDIRPEATRVGVGVFSNDFYHMLDIGGYPDKNILIRTIKATPYYSGNTYTGKGIHGMRTHGFRPEIVRPNVTKIGVVITDGQSRHRTNTVAQATLAKEEHIWVFTIGVGRSVDEDELAAIASVPTGQFSFRVDSFSALTSLTNPLGHYMCNLQQPQSDGATCGQDTRGDVVFAYNAGGMSTLEVGVVKDFVSYLVGLFSMATGNVRVGLVSSATQGGDINLEQYIRGDDFITALMNQPRPRLSPLLKKVRLQSFDPVNGGRHNAKKLVIVVLDGAIADSSDALFEAVLLKYENAVVYVVGVGNTVKESEMKQIASSPDYIKTFLSYNDLRENTTKRKEFLAKFCESL
ncbi:hypothetical protein ACOMHN_026912 [Nucella lapillus]